MMAILRIEFVLSIGLTSVRLAQARFLRGESTIPESNTVCVTEDQCQQKFLAMNTGGRFSVGEYPYKGCVLKNINGFFGTGGTVEEMSVAEFSGTPERIWCDTVTVTENLIYVMPTISPVTDSPSHTPTQQPTVIPSVSISFDPSREPTLSFTQLPSISPSIGSTMEPSYNPSTEPSYSPSTEPSYSPSTEPSYSPSTSSSAFVPPLKQMFLETDDDYEMEILGNQSRSTSTSTNTVEFLIPAVFIAGVLLATLFVIKARLVRKQDERRLIDDDNIDIDSSVHPRTVDVCQQTSFEQPVEFLENTDDKNIRSFPCVAASENDAGPMERVMEPLYDLIDNWRRVISPGSNLPPSSIIIQNPFSTGEDDDDDHSSTLANTIDLFPRYMRSMDVSITSSGEDDHDDSRSTSDSSSSSSGPSYALPLSFVKSSSVVSRTFSGHEAPASES